MGKGDKKSRRGKIFKGSFGKSRPHKTKKKIIIPVAKPKVIKTVPIAIAANEAIAPTIEVKASVKAAAKKPKAPAKEAKPKVAKEPKPKADAKKEPKPKKAAPKKEK